MKFTGKTNDELLVPACQQVLTVNYAGQDVDIECFLIRGHDGKHGGILSVISHTHPSKLIGIGEFFWDEYGVRFDENRYGFFQMLTEKIPALNKKADWPCECIHCLKCDIPDGPNISIADIIINLNDICKWGRTPEENSERNIISWLDSLDFDFTLRN